MRTKLVVINEHTLGYIHPLAPNEAGILNASCLRGATRFWCDGPIPLSPLDNVRLATPADFNTFRVVFSKGYQNPAEYEMAA